MASEERRVVEVDGGGLEIRDVVDVARDLARARLGADVGKRMERSRTVVVDAVERGAVMYGITTGFGALADTHIGRADIERLQVSLLRSHAAGVGEPLGDDVVRGLLLLRARTLTAGYSGVRVDLPRRLLELLDLGLLPVVPGKGSVGASGSGSSGSGSSGQSGSGSSGSGPSGSGSSGPSGSGSSGPSGSGSTGPSGSGSSSSGSSESGSSGSGSSGSGSSGSSGSSSSGSSGSSGSSSSGSSGASSSSDSDDEEAESRQNRGTGRPPAPQAQAQAGYGGNRWHHSEHGHQNRPAHQGSPGGQGQRH